MIIDCHGHYTTAPEAHNQWRIDQLAAFGAGEPSPAYPEISDEVIRASIAENQLKLITERGSDLTIFSSRDSRFFRSFSRLSLKLIGGSPSDRCKQDKDRFS